MTTCRNAHIPKCRNGKNSNIPTCWNANMPICWSGNIATCWNADMRKMLIEPLQLTSGWSKASTLIRHQDVTEAHKTLGVLITPTGDESAQVTCHISNLVLSSNFSRIETLTAYRTMWFPAVSNSLGMTTMSSLQLKSIQRTRPNLS
jgi:hypothetical protein